jgi:iron complex transport system substrate-binding protein
MKNPIVWCSGLPLLKRGIEGDLSVQIPPGPPFSKGGSRHAACARTVLSLAVLAVVGALYGAAQAQPQRVISLAPSITETVYALGFGDRLVGVSTYCDYPPEAMRIERVGTFLSPNAELIVAKRPDLVLAVPSPGNRNPVESLQRLGLKVVVVDPQTLAEIKEAIVTIARELGNEAAGRKLVGEMEARNQELRERLADAPRRKVLMVVGHSPLIAVGPGTFQDELIRLARGVNVAAETGRAWPHLSVEFVIAAAPEVIIDTTAHENPEGGGSDFWSTYSAIPAVREGRVHAYREYALLRPGPRIAEALQRVARFIHPERFR